jgi:hypothetical protein
VISVHNAPGNELGIDSNFNRVSFGAHSVSLRRMEEKYGPRGLDRYLSQPSASAAGAREQVSGRSP